jgi:C-terminal processing protease CtpA/Prc
MVGNVSKLRRKARILAGVCVVLTLLLLVNLYFTYDYYVARFVLGGSYIFTEDLRETYDSTLGEHNFRGFSRSFNDFMVASMTDAIYRQNQDRYTFLYTPAQYARSLQIERADAALSQTGVLSDTTAYVALPNISRYTRRFLLDNRVELNRFENIVIDLRDNYGGMLTDMYGMAELFLPRDAVIGYEVTRFDILSTRVISSSKKYFDFNKIVILINGNTASAAEGFTLALAENLENVTVMGETSFGKGIGQVSMPLLSGHVLNATVLEVKSPSHMSIHNTGITPHIPYVGDDIIQKALEYIHSQEEEVWK